MMLFDVRLSLRERPTGVSTEVDVRLQVEKTPDGGYKAFNPVTSPIWGAGATPQSAILDFLNQQLHSVEALTFNQGLR